MNPMTTTMPSILCWLLYFLAQDDTAVVVLPDDRTPHAQCFTVRAGNVTTTVSSSSMVLVDIAHFETIVWPSCHSPSSSRGGGPTRQVRNVRVCSWRLSQHGTISTPLPSKLKFWDGSSCVSWVLTSCYDIGNDWVCMPSASTACCTVLGSTWYSTFQSVRWIERRTGSWNKMWTTTSGTDRERRRWKCDLM